MNPNEMYESFLISLAVSLHAITEALGRSHCVNYFV